MGDIMSNNFIKRKGHLRDNSDLNVGKFNIKVLESYDVHQILAELKSFMTLGVYGQFTSAKALNYYIDGNNRLNNEKYFSLTELFGLPKDRLIDIAKKNLNVTQDFLSFYGYDAMSRGNLYIYASSIKRILIDNVRYAVKNNILRDNILKFYNYQTIPEIIRNKNSIPDNDFYFSIGDGNYLYGQVHTLNERKREFQILYVLYDEYNWDDNVTYFIKRNSKNNPYRIVIETAAFKKLEKEGIAKPFLQFFIDTYTVSY